MEDRKEYLTRIRGHLENKLEENDLEIVMRHLQSDTEIPEITSQDEYAEFKRMYEDALQIVGEREFHTPLGVYVTTLGARLIEWEESNE